MSDLEKLMRDRIKAHSGSRRWYEISNADAADGDTAVMRIYDEISYWGISAEAFAADLSAVTAPKIEVQINSPGGSVFDGVAIYNALRAHDAHVTTRVDGVAASIASVIAQAGDHRVILSGGQMMIHEAWGVAVGSASELREFADVLDDQNDNVISIYAERSGKDEATFRELLDSGADNWLNAKQAVELGLADEVLVPAKKGSKNTAKDAKASTKPVELSVDLTNLVDLLERANSALAAVTQATAQVATPTSLASERGEPTGAAEVTVDREDADRLLAALNWTEED